MSIHTNRNNNEVVLWKERAHWIIFTPFIVILFFVIVLLVFNFSLAFLTIPLFLFMLTVIQMKSTYFSITNKNLRGKTGPTSKQMFVIPLQSVESIFIHAGILGSFLNYGTFKISAQSGVYTVKHISKANLFKTDLMEKLIITNNP